MAIILIITDDKSFFEEIPQLLSEENHRFFRAKPENDDWPDPSLTPSPQMVIVDVTVKTKELISFYKNVKRQLGYLNWESTPLILAVTLEALRAIDFSLGINDFLVKPIEGRELVARIDKLLWQISQPKGSKIINIKELVIDIGNYQAFSNGRQIDLTFKEFELLKFLATQKGKVFSRDAILDRVWGYEYYGGTRTVDVHIRRIRAKLGPIYGDYVQTVRNVGYIFRDDPDGQEGNTPLNV